MDKEELLDNLKKMVNTEETAIPLYSEYIDEALSASPFLEAQKKQIDTYLKQLDQESKQHSLTFKRLIKKIERNRQDVY